MPDTFTQEQAQFRDIVARFCRDKCSPSEVRKWMATESGFDPQIWQALCQELAVTGLHIDERYGGSGFGPVELAIVMEEFGRALMCAPFLSSAVLCSTAVKLIADESQQHSLLPKLINGERIGTLACSEDDRNFLPTTPTTVAISQDNEWRLSGSKTYVLDGLSAHWILVLAATGDDLGLYLVEQDAAGMTTHSLQVLDPTRKLCRIDFQDTPAQRLGAHVEQTSLDKLYNYASVCLANEMVGGAQALLDAAVEYTQLRVQFGRSIGSFQSIKHRLADLLLEVELAKSAAYQAAQSLAEDDASSEEASLAKAAASEAYLSAGITCIQLHGGIGFTWENDTHLWFKRAKSSEVLFGTPAQHRERMLQAMGY